jgi:N-methylhydantoinase B/oxoprolinase/acetone carboxylase alpha subunit
MHNNPRPFSGCAAEVSQRIAESVIAALANPLPDRVTVAPASFVRDHGRYGPQDVRGRGVGGVNQVTVWQSAGSVRRRICPRSRVSR